MRRSIGPGSSPKASSPGSPTSNQSQSPMSGTTRPGKNNKAYFRQNTVATGAPVSEHHKGDAKPGRGGALSTSRFNLEDLDDGDDDFGGETGTKTHGGITMSAGGLFGSSGGGRRTFGGNSNSGLGLQLTDLTEDQVLMALKGFLTKKAFPKVAKWRQVSRESKGSPAEKSRQIAKERVRCFILRPFLTRWSFLNGVSTAR